MRTDNIFDKYAKQILIVPSLVILIILIMYPTVYLLRMSFSSYDLTSGNPPAFNRIDNLNILIKDKYFWQSMINTILISISAVMVEFILGLSLALIVSGIKKSIFFKTIFIISMMIPPIVIGLNFKLIYDQFGPLNGIFKMLGFSEVGWLTSPGMARISIIMADVWQWTPFMFIIILAGLQSVPDEYYDTAKVDGVGGIKMFLFVTWPMILPSITLAVALRFIEALKLFDIILMITFGGPSGATETLSLYIYRTAFRFGDLGYASFMAFTMLILLSIVITLFLRFVGLRKRLEW
ncbi:MAG: hypothetical protein DRP87_07845 [Spirochaetes bacterium]|nr:MAG: hypothetical protein DRP87_07845 [Spirochaetota bacterium]